MIDSAYIAEIFEILLNWLETEILLFSNLIELIILALFFLLSFIIAKHLKNQVNKLLNLIENLSRTKRKKILNIILRPFIFIVLSWIYYIIMEAIQGPNILSNIIVNLLTAWIIIKLFSILIPRGHFLLKIVFFLIWSIAVLNVLGIYRQVIEILDTSIFETGLTWMLIIQTVILFGILFWLAGKADNIIKKRIDEAEELTPSIKVLLYKFSKIVLYAVVIIVLIKNISEDIDLSAFAFLGGAIGVGLGFGLQKIVSNYISGIIILLDKSVKPGDVIEIDDIYGRIKSQETRFVSLVTRSGKEHLIPNENFITNQVINWSYSDDLVRIDVDLGVAYDSDMHLVKELMLKSLEDKERVLKRPKPACLMTEFGDNTVEFKLRFWISDPVNGIVNIKSEVLFSIWDLLKENNIRIAFPQRDLHFESISPELLSDLKRLTTGKEMDQAAATKEDK